MKNNNELFEEAISFITSFVPANQKSGSNSDKYDGPFTFKKAFDDKSDLHKCSDGTIKSISGRTMGYSIMDDNHLKNTIKFLQKCGQTSSITKYQNEAERRARESVPTALP